MTITLGHFNWIKFILSSEIKGVSQHLCLYLATYMNTHQDMAFPSLTTIEGHTGYTRPTITKHLDEIIRAGYLIKYAGNPAAHKSNTYQISFPKKVEHLVKEINHPSKGDLLDLVKEVNPNKQLGINNQNKTFVLSGEKTSDKEATKKPKYERLKSPPGFDEIWKLYAIRGKRKPSILMYKAKGLHLPENEQIRNRIVEHIKKKASMGHFLRENWRFNDHLQRYLRDDGWDNGEPIEDKRPKQAKPNGADEGAYL